MTVNHRVKILAGDNISAYARRIGVSVNGLTNVVNGRAGLGMDMCIRIITLETDLNCRWLLLGDEPMRMSGRHGDDSNRFELLEELELLRKLCKSYEAQIEALKKGDSVDKFGEI